MLDSHSAYLLCYVRSQPLCAATGFPCNSPFICQPYPLRYNVRNQNGLCALNCSTYAEGTSHINPRNIEGLILARDILSLIPSIFKSAYQVTKIAVNKSLTSQLVPISHYSTIARTMISRQLSVGKRIAERAELTPSCRLPYKAIVITFQRCLWRPCRTQHTGLVDGDHARPKQSRCIKEPHPIVWLCGF